MKSDYSSDRHHIISPIISLKVSCYIFSFFCVLRSHLSVLTRLHLWQQITKRIRRRWLEAYEWPDLWLTTDSLWICHICTGWLVRFLGDHSLESGVPLCDGALPPVLYFDLACPHIQHPTCAQVAYERTWNEQSKGYQSRWYSFTQAKEYHLLSECHPGNSYAYIKWSKPCKCLSLLGTSFSDTSSVVYAALHTEAGFCYGLIVTWIGHLKTFSYQKEKVCVDTCVGAMNKFRFFCPDAHLYI